MLLCAEGGYPFSCCGVAMWRRSRGRGTRGRGRSSWRGFLTGSLVRTDGWQAYWTVPDHGYTHDRVVISHGDDPAHVALPGAHRVASLLERWLLGTHQGSLSPQHLDAFERVHLPL